jgi:tetratricopeptide (TPR) repeat protein
MKKLKPEYEKDADNYEVFRPILKTLLQKGCSQDDPFIAELIAKDTKQGEVERQAAIEKWKTEEPDKYGLYLKSNGRADEAVDFLEKGINMNIGNQRLAEANYALAQIFHQKGQYAKARGYYTAAANNKSGWGDPYIEIGKMYAASVNSCGNGDGFQMGVIACAAIDMWGKAKSVDGSVSGEANSLIGKYSAYVPNKEDAFQRGVKEGQSASVGCWIGGSATVRLRSQY